MLGFHALASAPVSAQAGSPNILVGAINVSAIVAGSVIVSKPLIASITATEVTSALSTVQKPLASSVYGTVTSTQAQTTVLKPLAAAINTSAAVTANALMLNAHAANVTTTASAAAQTNVLKPLVASINVSASAAAQTKVLKPLAANISCSSTASGSYIVHRPLVSSIPLSKGDVFVVGDLSMINAHSASVITTAQAQAQTTVLKPLASSVSAAATTTAQTTVLKPLASSVSVAATKTAQTTILKPLASSVSVASLVTAYTDTNKPLQGQLGVSSSVSAQTKITKPLSSSVSIGVSTSAQTNVYKGLSASIFATETNVALSTVHKPLVGNIVATSTIIGSVIVDKKLAGSLIVASTIAESIKIKKDLSASIFVSAELNDYLPLNSNIQVSAKTQAILDVDDNTFGSPGGVPAEGFYPPSSLIFDIINESAPASSKTITADFSTNPSVSTEITSVSFSSNPAEAMSYLIDGDSVAINFNTPKEIYSAATTFYNKKEILPVYGIDAGYTVAFGTPISVRNGGGSFRSTKFYMLSTEGKCYLRDDGVGNINIIQELTSGLTKIIGSAGRVVYSDGKVEVQNLNVQSLAEAKFEFIVATTTSVVPTPEYLDGVESTIITNNLILASGSAVEVTSYFKDPNQIDILIFVTARSYNNSTPSVTLEERVAVYKVIFEADYSAGRDALLSTLQLQTA